MQHSTNADETALSEYDDNRSCLLSTTQKVRLFYFFNVIQLVVSYV